MSNPPLRQVSSSPALLSTNVVSSYNPLGSATISLEEAEDQTVPPPPYSNESGNDYRLLGAYRDLAVLTMNYPNGRTTSTIVPVVINFGATQSQNGQYVIAARDSSEGRDSLFTDGSSNEENLPELILLSGDDSDSFVPSNSDSDSQSFITLNSSSDEENTDSMSNSEVDSLFDEVSEEHSEYDPSSSIALRTGYIGPDSDCIEYRRLFMLDWFELPLESGNKPCPYRILGGMVPGLRWIHEGSSLPFLELISMCYRGSSVNQLTHDVDTAFYGAELKLIRKVTMPHEFVTGTFDIEFSLFWKAYDEPPHDREERAKDIVMLRHNLASPSLYARPYEIHREMMVEYMIQNWDVIWALA
ncbi:hypothetical protein M422DRAFT_267765 [Sphaerobolus stellatus SS14]|uniref:Uncharacterized protein n=1 Tax=Sphaerobolus stellatus (strain SS14) TaxID=990650 RepID=A0A0C9UNZ6_SPHS4|nr:hypothetical protein M422DRAFT_267765 [Sphaerobolus stellatus SS14]